MTTKRREFLQQTVSSLAWARPGAALAGAWGVTAARAETAGNADRGTWAGRTDASVYAAAWAARFTNPLPNLLAAPTATSAGFVYAPDAGSTNGYTIAAAQSTWDVLGIRRAGGAPVLTTVWGYGKSGGRHRAPEVTFPGKTFVVNRGTPVHVRWRNQLVDRDGQTLAHLLPVDQTISMQTDPRNVAIDGVPIAMHHHGGDTAAEFDGGPDQWITPRRVQVGPGVMLGQAGAPGVNAPALDDTLAYTYENTEEASMTWYHDHAEGLTRLNAYAGLAGAYIVRDSNEAELIRRNILPSGAYEQALLLQDKMFDARGQFIYPADPSLYVDVDAAVVPPSSDAPTHLPEMYGDVICVNGKAWPALQVEPRAYRLRLLNGCDSRFFTLTFRGADGTGAPSGFRLVGTDLGFGNTAPLLDTLTIGPGERYDLVLDFASLAGQTVVVGNTAATPYPGGDPVLAGSGGESVMAFKVTKPLNRNVPRTTPITDRTVLRGWLPPLASPRAVSAAPLLAPLSVPARATVRRVLLAEGADEYGRIMPLLGSYDAGTFSFKDDPTENVVIPAGRNSVTEVWEFWNASEDAHPLHMHLVRFRVLSRQAFECTVTNKDMINGWTGVTITDPASPQPALVGSANAAYPYETGWKDTVECPPGYMTRVLVTFNRPGKYVYHCHILSHEEHDMMRWYSVTKA